RPGSLVLILAGPEDRTRKAMSELRLNLGQQAGHRAPDQFSPLWVVDFPLFEFDAEHGSWSARHHPFTAPRITDLPALMHPAALIPVQGPPYSHPCYQIKANAYDLVVNGTELGGGSIRIHRREVQERMFQVLGLGSEEASQKFGFLLGAFEYGAPPHGGIAFGFDRLCALLGGSESIRDFIPFPKNNSGRDMMLDAPSPIGEAQLKELNLKLNK
ncbi:MAG TPA: amino acid--tRNA ligase-related protein, partial [Chitinophagaceae bacterium]|nr:amino acid--tRNA ligase-related protein [Chitinophagaceae bacterium]